MEGLEQSPEPAGFRGRLAFCSNFYPCKVDHQGLTFRCAEAAFQAAKFSDHDFRSRFAVLDGAGAKALGKTRHPSFRSDWQGSRVGEMRAILESKFADPTLRQELLATGDAPLVEVNTWGDSFWGVCRGRGENHLGKLLMELRTTIRAEESRRRVAPDATVDLPWDEPAGATSLDETTLAAFSEPRSTVVDPLPDLPWDDSPGPASCPEGEPTADPLLDLPWDDAPAPAPPAEKARPALSMPGAAIRGNSSRPPVAAPPGRAGMNALQAMALHCLAEAGHRGASWWGPKGEPVSRIYFPAPSKNSRAYLTFANPEKLESPTLCVDIRECGQPAAWYEGQRRTVSKKFEEAYARVLGLWDPAREALLRNDLEYPDLAGRSQIIPLKGKVF